MRKVALITGVTGQDGSFLSEYLLDLDYKVIGLARRSSTNNLNNLKNVLINPNFNLVYGDITDQGCMDNLISSYCPNEVYNLAAQSFVPMSWTMPEFTTEVNSLGPLKILEAIRRLSPSSKFYQASTSEMFGKVRETPQNELTPFYPRSPYGVSKVYAHWITVNYRESYDLFATSGILFNHESARRGLEFVTRKITNGVAKIKLGLEHELRLGNLDAKRDWGYAEEYVKWMHKMLQYDKPDTFVIGTKQNRTIREFCDVAFKCVNLDYRDYVKIDPAFYRPAEVDVLLSDTTKAEKELGFKLDVTFEQMVVTMVLYDEYCLRKGIEINE
jgi:GDPmannose 4,6-dehydratase